MTTTTTTTTDQQPQHPTYDGIEEHDNRLPRWWLLTLWSAIVFGFAYWVFYETLGIGDSPRETFNEAMNARRAESVAVAVASAIVGDEELRARAGDPAAVERGRVVYVSMCQACHADQGQGLVGPNLTDHAWLHGASPSAIYAVIADGVLTQGMPAWGPSLGPDRVKDATAFVLSLKGKNIPGKPPQGVVVAAAGEGAP